MPSTLTNIQGETWCPTCGVILDDDGNVLRPGLKYTDHANCPNVFEEDGAIYEEA